MGLLQGEVGLVQYECLIASSDHHMPALHNVIISSSFSSSRVWEARSVLRGVPLCHIQSKRLWFLLLFILELTG
jgi:hypothetical protein